MNGLIILGLFAAIAFVARQIFKGHLRQVRELFK